jgi:phage tail-like protein
MRQDEIESLLPLVFQRAINPGSPLDALLAVMEGLHLPVEEALSEIEVYFDPYRAPDEFVPYLARWVDLAWLLPEDGSPYPAGLGRLRDLIRASAELSRWRGTQRGLMLFLRLATGQDGFEISEPNPFEIHVHIPRSAGPFKALVDRIVQMQKPAYAVYTPEVL